MRPQALRFSIAGVLMALAAAVHAVEVNTASQAELERVKGIGVSLSTTLLAERAKQPFADWADLRARVGGIGAAQAERLSRGGLTVAGRAYGAAAPASAPVR